VTDSPPPPLLPPAQERAKSARYRASEWASAPGRVGAAVVIGLLILGLGTYWGTATLQREVVAEALAEQGREVEAHIEALVARYGREAATLDELGPRLVQAAEVHPAIRDLVVAGPDRRVVARYPRGAGRIPCLPPGVAPAVAAVAAGTVRREHAAGQLGEAPVACTMVPIRLHGNTGSAEVSGVVLFHAARDWRMVGAQAREWLLAATRRLAPLFGAFYLLLACLLFFAARAARRWRRRAESAARVEALGALASGINHEIKNPLNTVGLSLQFLARRHDDPETREVVASAEREAARIGDTLDEFARFTRVSRLETQPVSLREEVRAASNGHVLVTGDARARVDADKMRDALSAILGPVFDGPVEVTLDERQDRWVLVARGRPRDADIAVDRLFDPYVRPRRRDVGRGLALARAVFQAHGGDLDGRVKGGRLVLKGEAPKNPPGEME